MKATAHKQAVFVGILLLSGLLQACAYYSFSGASIPSHLETIAVPLAEDRSDNSIPGLDDDLTSLLTDQFVNRTRLSLSNDPATAGVILESTIDDYSNRPTSVAGNERAELNRVTIRVSIRYFDQQRDSVLVDQQFSSFEEYDPVQGMDGETAAARAALETLASDIFTGATSNW